MKHILLGGLLLASIFKPVATLKTAPNVPVENLNISILLDLSDRISTTKHHDGTMEFYKRDIEYIKTIENAFMAHVKRKKIFQLNDDMQVFFSPAPKDPRINNLSELLRVNFDRKSSKKTISTTDQAYAEIPQQIYQAALKDQIFVGADIWRFFKNNVHDYCIKPNRRNILVILTDGYMYHKDSKFTQGGKSSYITPAYLKSKKLTTSAFGSVMQKNGLGFIPATSGLQNLEIIVLNINPSLNSPYEEDVIKRYWSDWLRAMNVKKYTLQTTDLPSALNPVIQKMIL